MSMPGGPYKVFYREQYLSSCCHVCKTPLPKRPDYPCAGCALVFYCSSGHLEQDSEEHEEICEALNVVAEKLAVDNVFNKAYLLGGDAYREFRAGLMKMCSSVLERPLLPWEQELCLFPPVCATCHRISDSLEVCDGCEQTRWCCEGHRPKSHEKSCRELSLYREVLRKQQKLVAVPVFPSAPGPPPPRMEALQSGGDIVEFALLSEIATCPLTVLNGLKELEVRDDNLVIHIVGPEPQFEMTNLRKWDDFLFRYLDGSLTLVFIGPEIGKLPSRRVVSEGRTLQFLFNSCLYHEYQGLRPHLVCLFNPGLYRLTGFGGCDSWKETISSLFSSGSPVLVTSYTKKEIRADLKRVISDLGSRVSQLVLPQANPFASRRPLMNFVSDEATPVIFKNAYYMALREES